MMTTNPMKTAARSARRKRRFDRACTEHRECDAACVRCGITTSETLVPVKRRFLEGHHICGQANDDALTVPVCRNCHAILTEGQQAAGMIFEPPATLLHQVAAALTSFFTFLHDLCERGMQWADALFELASDLDTAYPAWRDFPSAKALEVRS